MMRRWTLAGLMFVMLCLPLVVGSVRAESVNVTVGQTSVTLNMDLSINENLTKLPLFNLYISPSNDTITYQQVLTPINSAIQNRVAAATVSSVTMSARTLNSAGMYFLQENYSIVVKGANVLAGTTVSSNLSFVQMNLSQSLPISGEELNAVGSEYLLKPINDLTANYTTLVYYIDGSNPRNNVIPDEGTVQFHMLQFSSIPPVSTWTSQSNLLQQSTVWTLHPSQAQYNLTMGLPTPEGPIIKAWVAIYNPSLSVTVPANANINGNTVSFDTPTSSELVMPIVIGAAVVILVAAVLLDHRISGKLRSARKKR